MLKLFLNLKVYLIGEWSINLKYILSKILFWIYQKHRAFDAVLKRVSSATILE